ncbi:hypothetical protein QBC43DRAFT_219266 [Cladorrhinum sp. PSN259]|nr:hypothetical protein QBC43DRAFT_219266 [Cladorrhinum sp. PSN259]
MRALNRLIATLWLVLLPVHDAEDGPIDFEKTPSGGPSTLRACAQLAYNPDSRAGSVWNVGCKAISCICRTDLLPQAYNSIESAVKANCGADSTVEIEAAKKVFNDYCSSNGFTILGNTYIVTQTVKISTNPANTTPTAIKTTVAADSSSGQNVTPGDDPEPATVTVGVVTVTMVTKMETATATVFRSRAGVKSPWPWFKYFFAIFLSKR